MTTKEDRKAPPGIDRERALAALIFCAGKHPDKSLATVVCKAIAGNRALAYDDMGSELYHMGDTELAACFHAYAKEQ